MNDYLRFKVLYTKFLKYSRYMCEKRLAVKDPGSKQWKDLVAAYYRNIVDPMEDLWSKLSKETKNYFMPNNKKI